MYTVESAGEVIGRTRLEQPNAIDGWTMGVFEPGPALESLRPDIEAAAAAVRAALSAAHASAGASELHGWFFQLGGTRESAAVFDRLTVRDEHARTLNARVTGLAQTPGGAWMIGAFVNDAEFWGRAAQKTL